MSTPPFHPPRILIVDEDARTARLFARMLREDGFEVELALDGAAAVGRLARAPVPDILVTDLQVPHVGGAAVARYGRSQHPGLLVFLITRYPELASDLVRMLDPPPLVFAKPLDYGAFVRKLGQITGRPPLRTEPAS